ncbi:MAG: hypothetical protein HUU04_00195 [Verrucomicrobiae bacterium]|nr:hypothetical protein [Verrucomicrobiae bacterium]
MSPIPSLLPAVAFALGMLPFAGIARAADSARPFLSHEPQRPLPTPSQRPRAEGPARFVDAARGSDANDGSEKAPWKTINHALRQIAAGDTLYLRGGSYFENVYCAVAGAPEKPIILRSFPGEVAIIDGGFPEFQNAPGKAWEPVNDGVEGEYRSTVTYRNIRDVVGLFGDSNVGLQTYWYRMDMQATNELWIPNPKKFVEPMYCGPGLWYDKQTGRIHARLAHTKLELPESVGHKLVHYQGETDPRKLPLVVAPVDSIPLRVSQAMHVRFQDLVIRGGGYITVKLNFGVDIAFDRCTIYAGTYGIWAKGAGPLKMTNCGVFGMIAPWMFRTENVSYAYSPKIYPPFIGQEAEPEIPGKGKQEKRVVRHISRLPTHAVLATEGGFEFETFYYPLNHTWDIAYCEFTDGHDGVYLSGRDIRFHHNLVDNMQDDAVYVSSPTPYVTDGLSVYQNLIRQCVAGFGAHARGGPGGKIYLYRNVVDMRRNLQFNRPTDKKPQGHIFPGHLAWLVHNPDHIISMEHIYLYQNTTLTQMGHALNSYTAGMAFHFDPEAERRVFNNLHVFVGGGKQYPKAWGFQRDAANLVMDGNLHWHSDPDVKIPANYYESSRTHPLSESNKVRYAAGWDAHSVIGDPKFVAFSTNLADRVDLRLRPDSPAVKAGVTLPQEWPDPLRPEGATRPDIGAIPLGGEPLKVGIDGRTEAGSAR